MAKRNPYPVTANVFGYMKYISADHDCIDEDFDDLQLLPFQLIDIPQDIQHAN